MRDISTGLVAVGAHCHRAYSLGLATPCERVGVVHIDERMQMLAHSRRNVVRQIEPSVSDVDLTQLTSPQQGRGAHLVLGVVLAHAPHALVEELQHIGRLLSIEIEQRQVPPVVRVHEAVAFAPRVRVALHPRGAAIDLSRAIVHVTHGMLRPWIVAQ